MERGSLAVSDVKGLSADLDWEGHAAQAPKRNGNADLPAGALWLPPSPNQYDVCRTISKSIRHLGKIILAKPFVLLYPTKTTTQRPRRPS